MPDMIPTKLKAGQVIEDVTWKVKLEVLSVSGDPKRGQSVRVKVLDLWDDYTKGGSPQGCFSSYLETGKEYRLYRNKEFPNEDTWLFSQQGLKRKQGSLLLLDVDLLDGATSLDMDS